MGGIGFSSLLSIRALRCMVECFSSRFSHNISIFFNIKVNGTYLYGNDEEVEYIYHIDLVESL